MCILCEVNLNGSAFFMDFFATQTIYNYKHFSKWRVFHKKENKKMNPKQNDTHPITTTQTKKKNYKEQTGYSIYSEPRAYFNCQKNFLCDGFNAIGTCAKGNANY